MLPEPPNVREPFFLEVHAVLLDSVFLSVPMSVFVDVSVSVFVRVAVSVSVPVAVSFLFAVSVLHDGLGVVLLLLAVWGGSGRPRMGSKRFHRPRS